MNHYPNENLGKRIIAIHWLPEVSDDLETRTVTAGFTKTGGPALRTDMTDVNCRGIRRSRTKFVFTTVYRTGRKYYRGPYGHTFFDTDDNQMHYRGDIASVGATKFGPDTGYGWFPVARNEYGEQREYVITSINGKRQRVFLDTPTDVFITSTISKENMNPKSLGSYSTSTNAAPASTMVTAEQRARVKVGQIYTRRLTSASFRILQTDVNDPSGVSLEPGVFAVLVDKVGHAEPAMPDGAAELRFLPYSALEIPEPEKAIPGAVYLRKTTRVPHVGLRNGRLGGPGFQDQSDSDIEFDSTQFTLAR